MYKLQRRDELDRQIEQLALLLALAPMVGRLQCFRGISLHSAMVLATEIVDWRRFEHPRQRRDGPRPRGRIPNASRRPSIPPHFEVRRVSNAGTFRLHCGQKFLSQALNGESIGLEEVHDGIWNILYYDTLLGLSLIHI